MQEGDKQQPGQVIAPGQQNADEKAAPTVALPSQWQFKPETDASAQASAIDVPSIAPVSWTASEFIAHDKAAGWYGRLAIGGIALATLIYIFTRGDWIATAMMLVVTLIFGVFAARKPRTLTYGLDQNGLQIAQKFYPYTDFKSFSLLDEGGVNGIWLMPLKRFMPSITIYYAPPDEEKILGVLSNYLPLEDKEHDVVDKFMRRVRF